MRMLAYNGSIPGPDAQGAGGLGGRRRHREPGRRGGHRPLARAAAREPLRRNPRDPAADAGRASGSPPGWRSPTPALYWYHPHIREDYGQEMGLYGNVLVEPADPDYWPPAHREVVLTLDDILLEDGKVAPFSRAETTHAAMGRFGDVLLVSGETDLSLSARARRGRSLLPDQHRQHPRVQGRAAGRADEAGRRRQRPCRARGVRRRRGARSVRAGGGRRAVRPSRRAGARAPHPGPGLPAGRDHGERGAGRAVAGGAVRGPAHERRHGRRAGADRPVPGGRARQDARLHRRDGPGRAGGRRAGRLRVPDAPRGGQRRARPLPRVRDEAAAVEAPTRPTPARCTPRSSATSRATARSAG